MSKPTIHSELRSSVRLNAFVGAPLFAIAGLAVLVVNARSYSRGETAAGVLLLNSVIGMLLVWVAWYLWQSRAWHAHVTWLLESTVHTPMRVSFSRNERGALVARLHNVADAGLKEPRIELVCAQPAFDPAPMQGQVVKAHVDPDPDGPVVLHTPLGIVWPLEGCRRRDLRRSGSG
jgi:hypothetical protein